MCMDTFFICRQRIKEILLKKSNGQRLADRQQKYNNNINDGSMLFLVYHTVFTIFITVKFQEFRKNFKISYRMVI